MRTILINKNIFSVHNLKINYINIIIISMCAICLINFFSILTNYNNSFVHADYFRYILPETLRNGLAISWDDLINTLQLRSPGEFRPRFLAYGIQALDQKIRLYLYNYTIIHPTIAPLAWFLQLFIAPYYLYMGVFNLTKNKQSAIITIIIYCTSIGFLSGFTMGLLQGKALSNVIFILSFFLMTSVNKDNNKKNLLYKTKGLVKYLLLLTIFLGLFIDELPIYSFAFIPLMFPNYFLILPNNWGKVKHLVYNSIFWTTPILLFLITVMYIIPTLTIKYFGFDFDYIGNTLALGENKRGALSFLQGPYATFSFMLVIKNFLTMFGLSLVPWQISPLTPSGFGDYFGGQINNIPKLIIFTAFFSSLAMLICFGSKLRSEIIGLLCAFGLFMIFLSILLVRHIPIATGYYYGAPFAVFFSILIGLYYFKTLSYSKAISFLSVTLVLSIVLTQIDNFIPINKGWIKTHNEDIARPSFMNELTISPPGKIKKTELKLIWTSWKNNKLEEYLSENSISSGAIYLAYELKMIDKVRKEGSSKPINWLELNENRK